MAKIIGNPTVTPMAIPDWSQTNEARADFIKNKPTKLSEFVNDIDSLPSVVYTEIDNFTDGVCKVTPKSPNYYLWFDGEEFVCDWANYPFCVVSDTYALCIASHHIEVGGYDYDYYDQTLIFANGRIYTRTRNIEAEVDSGWSKWRGLSVDYAHLAGTASSADNAVKAQKDGKGNIISDTYIKNTDYATKDVAGVVKVNKDSGIKFADNKTLMVVSADEESIDKKSSSLRPITPSVLDYAVKSVGDGYYAKEEQVADTYATKEEFADKFTWKLLGEATVTEANVTDAGEDGVKSIAIDCGDLSGYDELRFNLQCGVNEANADLSNVGQRSFNVGILNDVSEVVGQDDKLLVSSQGNITPVLNHTYINNLIINSYFTDGILQYSEIFNTNYNSHNYRITPSVALPSLSYKIIGTATHAKYGHPIDLKSGNHIVVFQTTQFKFPSGTELKVYGR